MDTLDHTAAACATAKKSEAASGTRKRVRMMLPRHDRLPDSVPCLLSVSIVVPTYREAESLPHLINRLNRVRRENNLKLELLIIDDNSCDGTVDLIRSVGLDWVRLKVRCASRGLSAAVLDGLRDARYEVLLVMDADLSHPPEKIPEMIATLASGYDFVVGSRYVSGGSTDAKWGLFRWFVSKIATWLARPLADVCDPMAGFFAFRRCWFEHADCRGALNPVGYKIGLELIVKCGFRRIVEIPIHFRERQYGRSKLSVQEQFRYIQHLYRLFIYKYGPRTLGRPETSVHPPDRTP